VVSNTLISVCFVESSKVLAEMASTTDRIDGSIYPEILWTRPGCGARSTGNLLNDNHSPSVFTGIVR